MKGGENGGFRKLWVRTEPLRELPRPGLGAGVTVRIMCPLDVTIPQTVTGLHSARGKGKTDHVLREKVGKQLPEITRRQSGCYGNPQL